MDSIFQAGRCWAISLPAGMEMSTHNVITCAMYLHLWRLLGSREFSRLSKNNLSFPSFSGKWPCHRNAPRETESVPPELVNVYQGSVYRCPELGIAWRTGGQARRHSGAVIGAWNPRSISLSSWKNAALEHALRKQLSAKWSPTTVWGGMNGWWEKHFWIEGILFPQATRIADQFGQNAFLYLDGYQVTLYVAAGKGIYLPVLR